MEREAMKLEIGTPLYLYTARNGKFNVHEGVVTENRRRYWSPLIVKFEKRSGVEFVPKEDDIGHILTSGPKLWLTERDDVLARKLLLEYEEGKLAELERVMAKKKELIAVLRESEEIET